MINDKSVIFRNVCRNHTCPFLQGLDTKWWHNCPSSVLQRWWSLLAALFQDKDFLKPLLHKIHVNPPAEVSTSLKVYQGHTLEKTYMGEDFFWAITPMAGDYVLIKFDRPVSIER